MTDFAPGPLESLHLTVPFYSASVLNALTGHLGLLGAHTWTQVPWKLGGRLRQWCVRPAVCWLVRSTACFIACSSSLMLCIEEGVGALWGSHHLSELQPRMPAHWGQISHTGTRGFWHQAAGTHTVSIAGEEPLLGTLEIKNHSRG